MYTNVEIFLSAEAPVILTSIGTGGYFLTGNVSLSFEEVMAPLILRLENLS